MRSVSIRLEDLCKITIPIGFAGENLRTTVRIDCMKMFQDYPDAIATLSVKPPEGKPYPTVVTRDGDIVIWEVTSSDLASQGYGEIQLSFLVDDVVAKSFVGKTRVDKSILPTGQAPDPINDWIIRAEAALEGIPATIQAALEEAKESGEFDGFSPIATVTKENKVTTISITDVNGTTTASIKDPEYTDLIDDTADAGVLDKTWSADKLTTDLSNKADKADTVLDTTLSRGRLANSTVGTGSFAFGTNVEASGDYSHAEGGSNTASGYAAHAEGAGTRATSVGSHAEGSGGAVASGAGSHAEGSGTTASGAMSHAEGSGTRAEGVNSHAEGIGSKSVGAQSHAEGAGTIALQNGTHAEGFGAQAIGQNSHAEGGATIANGDYSHVGGAYNIPDSIDWDEWVAGTSYAEGDRVKRTEIIENKTVVTGYTCRTANSDSTFTISKWTRTNLMNYVEIIGNGTSDNARSNARTLDWNGNETIAGSFTFNGTLNNGRKVGTTVGYRSIANGTDVTASGYMAYAEGAGTTASGSNSHAEGVSAKATSNNAHAENDNTVASGMDSHAEGTASSAKGYSSHAQNMHTTAVGMASHSEGQNTLAASNFTHAEGVDTVAMGDGTHVEGKGTIANGDYSHVSGRYNIPEQVEADEWVANTQYNVGDEVKRTVTTTDGIVREYLYVCKTANHDATFTASKWTKLTLQNYAEIIGNGTADDARSNARTLDWQGNEVLSGDLTIKKGTADEVSVSELAEDVGDLKNQIEGKQDKPETAGTAGQVLSLDSNLDPVWTTPQSGGGSVTDVQVNGTSVVTSGVANVPFASNSAPGVVIVSGFYGHNVHTNGVLIHKPAASSTVKSGTETNDPIVPSNQHVSAFYGLSKIAGYDLKNVTVTEGVYPEESKSAISEMLNGAVSVSGTTPSITAKAGVRYICGEVSTLTIVVPASGCIDVTFESGSTATVLTVTPPTGMTMKWANGFDPTALEANTTYEINIMDGCLGVAGSWS